VDQDAISDRGVPPPAQRSEVGCAQRLPQTPAENERSLVPTTPGPFAANGPNPGHAPSAMGVGKGGRSPESSAAGETPRGAQFRPVGEGPIASAKRAGQRRTGGKPIPQSPLKPNSWPRPSRSELRPSTGRRAPKAFAANGTDPAPPGLRPKAICSWQAIGGRSPEPVPGPPPRFHAPARDLPVIAAIVRSASIS
jgi:hypothetical protein